MRRIDRHGEFIGSTCYCPTTRSRHHVPGDPSYRDMRAAGYRCPGCGLHVPVYVEQAAVSSGE